MGINLASIKSALLGSPSTSKNTQLGLQDFYKVATERGFARDYHFRVTQIGDSKLANDEFLYIRAVSTPEREILSESLSFRGFKYNVPLTSAYPGSEGWNIEFLMDRKYQIYDLLETWQRSHFNEGTLIGREMPTFDRSIELIAIDEQNNIVKKFKLYGCFPRKIGPVKYSMAGNGGPVSFELTLAYQYWTSNTVSTAAAATSKGVIESFLQGLRTVTGVVQQGTNIIRAVKSIPGL